MRHWLFGVAAAGLVLAVQPAFAETVSARNVDANSFSGAYLAGRVAEVDNDLDSAITFYRRALSFDPQNQAMQQSLMLALISRGRFDESLPVAEKLKTVPEIERFSRLALAVDSFRKKDYPGAEIWLKLALESDLDRLISGLMTAWTKAGAGDGKDAIAFVDKMGGPEWYQLFTSYTRALIADATGQTDVARKAYEATTDNVAAGGGAPETWLRAVEAHARFLARQGDRKGALAVLDKADEFVAGRVQIATLRSAIEAGGTIAPLVSGPSEGASEVLLNLATALNRGGGESFVRLYLQYALALTPDNDAVILQLADVAEQQGQSEEAIALYRRVPASSPFKRMSELQLGLNLADLKRQGEAIPHIEALIEQNPDDMRAYMALGGVYSAQDNFRAAADNYDRAVSRLANPAPGDWNVFYQRGIAYERLKEWPKAEPNFRKALELNPDQPQVLNYLGYSLVDMNMKLDEGLALVSKAAELRPSDGYIIDSLGWAFYMLGRYEEAVVELERAVSLKPDDPILNDHLGDAYWRVGRRLEATFQWNHARDLKPEPDVLAKVQQKLIEGLPPVGAKPGVAVKSQEPAPRPETEATPDKEPEKRSEIDTGRTGALAKPASYVVQRGESLWSIAAEELGQGERYREILDLNPELRGDPARIRPGQSLTLPGI